VNVVRNRPTIDELKNELKSLGANEVFTEEEVFVNSVPREGEGRTPWPKIVDRKFF
jgi:hypothetical protein